MKCPLFCIVPVTEHYPGNPNPDDCLLEECAWWEILEKKCIVPLIEARLYGIRAALFDLVEIGKGGKGK